VLLFSFDWFNFFATFDAILIVEFIFGSLLSLLLTVFTNWSSIQGVTGGTDQTSGGCSLC